MAPRRGVVSPKVPPPPGVGLLEEPFCERRLFPLRIGARCRGFLGGVGLNWVLLTAAPGHVLNLALVLRRLVAAGYLGLRVRLGPLGPVRAELLSQLFLICVGI